MPDTTNEKKSCFVVMPIADVDGYPQGHFKRVYDYIIAPACEKAGFKTVRADDVKSANMIIVDILNRIIEAEIVICDLSARNPNVMYELGIRHAFNLPVVLMKDNQTQRIFDISGLRDLVYDESLRIDTVNKAVIDLSEAIQATYSMKGKETNSIISLLRIQPAAVPEPREVNPDTQIILTALQNLKEDLRVEATTKPPTVRPPINFPPSEKIRIIKAQYDVLSNPNLKVHHNRFGEGTVVGCDDRELRLFIHFDQDDTARWIGPPYEGITILAENHN